MLCSMSSSSCGLDTCSYYLLPIAGWDVCILEVVNASLRVALIENQSFLKQAVSWPGHICLVSNLPFLGKVVEKLLVSATDHSRINVLYEFFPGWIQAGSWEKNCIGCPGEWSLSWSSRGSMILMVPLDFSVVVENMGHGIFLNQP